MIELKEKVSATVKSLRDYNDWRRGGEGEMPDPQSTGADIDAACELLVHCASLLAAMTVSMTTAVQALHSVERIAPPCSDDSVHCAPEAWKARLRDAQVIARVALRAIGETIG